MKFRIKEYKKGFIVQVQKTNWLGLSKWIPFITYYGLREVYYHSSYSFAEKNLLDSVKWDTARNSILLNK